MLVKVDDSCDIVSHIMPSHDGGHDAACEVELHRADGSSTMRVENLKSRSVGGCFIFVFVSQRCDEGCEAFAQILARHLDK